MVLALFYNVMNMHSENDRFLECRNKLLQDIVREPFSGIGKPEALKHNLSGFWSAEYLTNTD